MHDTVTYIAGFVEKSLRKRVKCLTCIRNINCLEDFNDIALIICKDFGGPGGGLVKPKKDIVVICQIAEKEIAKFESNNQLKDDNFYHRLLTNCFQKISDNIFSKFFEEENAEHLLNCPYNRDCLIKYCFEMFFKIKLYYIGDKISSKLKDKSIRQKYNKLVLFSGQ